MIPIANARILNNQVNKCKMRYILKLLSVVILSNCVFVCDVAEAVSSGDYINLKSKEAKDLFTRVYQQYDSGDDAGSNSVGKWKNLWSRESKASQPRAVNLFDEIFIVDEQQVFSVALNLDKANNNTRDEHQLNLASPNEPIKFIKSYFWNDLSFFIICQITYCTHYQQVNALTFNHQQVIKYPGLIPIDASYFTHRGKPHLIVAYNLHHYFTNGLPPSKIYQWNGTHMHWINDIFVPFPTSVITFPNGQSTIILFTIARNAVDDANQNSACLIYQFNDQSFIQRITSFTNMNAVTSIYPYKYDGQQFFLKIDYMGAAEILLWNGTAFEKLIDLPNIQPFDQITIVQIDDQTLLFISDLNALHIYKIENQKVTLLNDLLLLKNQRIIETTVWKYENSIMVLLIKLNPDGTFQTELWQLNLHLVQSDSEKYKDVRICFKELRDILSFRASAMENFKITQSRDFSYLNSSSKTFPFHLSDLTINDGNISIVEFRDQENELPNPRLIKEKLLKLKENANIMKNAMNKNRGSFSGNISVDSNVYFEELYIDHLKVDYVNSELADYENYLISGVDQQFSIPMSVKKVNIDDLNVSSLCGYGFDHWMQVNDSIRSKISSFKSINSSSIINDTIVIESGLIIEELNTKKINEIDLNDFLEDVFMIGKEQVIRGEVRYEGIVQVTKLYADKVNNVSSSDLITKSSNQTLSDVLIDTLEVEQLYVEKINGVPIDKAARMSRENVIKGKVTLSNFIISDQLTVQQNIAIPLTHSIQVYDEIFIDGNVFVQNLQVEDHTSLNISSRLLNTTIHKFVKGSWSKSSNQIIEGPITFEKGASIDQLHCSFLNGLGEQDFLYSDSQEFNDLENVTFNDFQFNRVIDQSFHSASLLNFIEESNDLLTFRRPIRMRYLSVDNIFTDKYNGIPVESVMQSNDLLAFPETLQFETVRVDGQMTVNELRMNRFNKKNSLDKFEKALRTDEHLTLQFVSGNSFTFRSLNVSQLNGQDFEKALTKQENLVDEANNNPLSLTIDAEVTIEGNIQVDRINNEEARDYISRLRDVDPSDLIDIKSLVRLTIMENLDVELLNRQNVDDIFAASLSLTKQQTWHERVTFINAHINYLTADKINNVDLSKLMYTDQPCVFDGNAAFSSLYVDGNVKSKTINAQNLSEFKHLHHIPITSIENLLVQGDIQWNNPSTYSHSLTYLFDNAVTKHEDQFIDGPIIFEKPIAIQSLYLSKENSDVSQKISDIISDTVLDNIDSNPISVKGTKIFKQELTVGSLNVYGNIDIKYINDLDIDEISTQIFQKDRTDAIPADITFLNEVEIVRLVTNNEIHGVPLNELAIIGQKMPKKLQFQNLVVDGDVSLHKLDGVEFDDFIKRRVTLDEDNEIFVDVEFINSVRVLNGSLVSSVNQIVPQNLAQNNADGTPIIIHGNKMFDSKLVVEQNLETQIINDFNVDSIYNNAVLNGTDTDILGSLMFENDVEISGNVYVAGEINRMKLQRLGEIKYLQNRLALNTVNKGISFLNQSLNEASSTTTVSSANVLYLEEENKLNLHFARVQSIKSSATENKTRLEIIATEAATFCGLESDCSCRNQYVVDLLPSGEYEIQEKKTTNVTLSFYPPNGVYGLKIICRTVSYSEQCSKPMDDHESSQVFWFKFNKNEEVLRRTPAVELIDGYVSDAQIFQANDQLYLIVAIFYNKEIKSHATNSLLYQFDMMSGKAFLVQSIPTDGAKSVDVFLISNVGIHCLIGCIKGRSESLLLRFNPIARQFQMVRTFATGGSKYIASVSSSEKSFVILNNPDVSALQIFNYDEHVDNFVDYQNIFFKSKVTSLDVFYDGDFGHSDTFVVTTTKDGWLYMYEYTFYGKFQLKMSYWTDDIQILTPFRHMNQNYLFAGFKFNSTVYKVIQQEYY